MTNGYPVRFSVEYPDRDLNRLTTFFRIFTAIPILFVLGSIAGYSSQVGEGAQSTTVVVGGTGLLFLPPLLMIVFRQKYPALVVRLESRACCVSRTAWACTSR